MITITGTRQFPFFLSTGIFSLLVLVLAGLMLYVSSINQVKTHQNHHQEIAKVSVSQTASEIGLYIRDRRRMAELFVRSYTKDLGDLADNPNNTELRNRIDLQTKSYFDEAHNFTLASSTGKVLLSDPDKYVGKGCRVNIRDFATHRSPNEVFIHSNPHISGYHIDILSDLDRPEKFIPEIFYISMATPVLQNILQNSQTAGHRLLLLREDQDKMIELTAEGPGKKLSREPKLSSIEFSNLLARMKVPDTRWLLVDLPNPGLLENYRIRVWREAILMYGVLLLVVLTMLAFVYRAEKQRKAADDALLRSNANLEHRVQMRTEELRNSVVALQYEATHDGLTNLYNRSTFERKLDKTLDDRQDEIYTSVLLYIDLDNFKVINETAGHAAGDECLRQLARVIGKSIPPETLIGRLSGDEFAVLISDVSVEKGVDHANRIINSIRQFRFIWDDREFEIGCSIGAVPVDRTTNRQDLLLGSADMACMAAKEGGKNNIQLFRPKDEDLRRRRSEMDWATRFRKALQDNMFELHAQPIIGAAQDTGGYLWYELLIRLRDEAGNMVFPNDFIPAAERYGGMAQIDCWTFNTAVDALIENSEQPFKFNVNLSGQTLGDEEVLGCMLETISRNADIAHKLCLEVTETAAIRSFSYAQPFFKKVRELGVKVALDDFGAGLSSYGYLSKIDLDYIKIDGSLVRDIERKNFSRVLVESINSLGRSLGKEVIAEYVENEETHQMLKSLGVAFGQGYHLGRPQPLSEVLEAYELPRKRLAEG